MNQPEKKFRAGAISAAIWENQTMRDGQQTSFNTISFERAYKDKQGQWQNTHSLRVSDIPKAVLVLNKAYEYLILKNKDSSSVIEEVVA